MSVHVADRILAAVEIRLAAIGAVSRQPFYAAEVDDLPVIFIESIADETVQAIGVGPLNETHRLTFDIFACVAGDAAMRAAAGTLRADIERALLASPAAISLDGIARPGLSRSSAAFRVEADTLQKPVGGWVLNFNCAYQLKTDAPDTPI